MRVLFVLIVVAAIGFLAWRFQAPLTGVAQRIFPQPPAATPEPAAPSPSLPPTPAPRPVPGIYYAIERVTSETRTGVKALNPGEEVRLMYRYKDGRVLVTNGRDEFTVKASTLTPDPSKVLQPAAR